MPAVNPGRANVNREGKGTGKRRVARVKRQTEARTAGPPAPPQRVTVAPADRTVERADKRAQQTKPTPSLPPARRDEKRPPAQKKRDAAEVKKTVAASRRKVVVARGRGAGVRAVAKIPELVNDYANMT